MARDTGSDEKLTLVAIAPQKLVLAFPGTWGQMSFNLSGEKLFCRCKSCLQGAKYYQTHPDFKRLLTLACLKNI